MLVPSADRPRSAESRPVVVVDPPPPGSVRVRMVVAYDGSAFHGMALNAGVTTVAGVLTEAIGRVVRTPVTLSVAGRTDRGVHAWGQVVSFDAPAEGLDAPALARAVTSLCGPAVVVREAAVVGPDFDARFSTVVRRYRYTVLARPVPDPFLAATSWWVPAPLDLAALRLACDPLIGLHDFSSFCRRPKGVAEVSLVRRVLDARWHDLGDGVLRFDVAATAFCHQMVRSMVGTLVDAGRGRLRPGDVSGILRARDRQAVTTVAPPHGLCLWAVEHR